MAANAELSLIFQEMSAVLELTGANPFRVNAYARAAQVIGELAVDVAEVGGVKELKAIEGIGEGTASKIIQYLETGKVKEHDDLLAKVPRGLLEVMAIPGVGPKTARLLWEKGGVTDIASLKKKIESGELEKLPRLGEKSLENIREAITFTAAAGERRRLGEALPLAEAICDHLRRLPETTQVQYAGSLRRGRETIGDVDILACSEDPAGLSEAFRTMEGVSKVLAAGETKSSVRLSRGIQVDLRIVDEASFGAALLYFTGSKQHNVVLRERAVKRKLRLNEYGLFPQDKRGEAAPQSRGVKPVAARTEQEIYAALELPWLPPEIREDRGELSLARTPDLIDLADVKADLHAHTLASDGRMTIEQLALAAKARGHHTVAVTDHSKSSAQAGGLSPDRLREHIEAIRAADEKIKGITILAGSEVDILADGRLDYDDDLLAELDVVVASPHSALRQETAVCTKRLVAAVRHPLVHVLGHPTGRLINRREGLHPDIDALIQAAVESDTALEINANPLRLDLRDAHVRAAVEAGALISINTDAHAPDQFDLLRYGILTARRGWLAPESCINAWTRAKLARWLKKKRD